MYVKQILLLVFIFILFLIPCLAQKNELKIVGTVIAEERIFGHIYGSDKVINTYLIVRLDKTVKGQEQSKYVLIQYKWTLKDHLKTLFAENESQWEFTLKKDKNCNSSLRNLQFVFFGDGKGKNNALLPRFRFKRGIESGQLPFAITLPCYQVNNENLKLVESLSPGQQNADSTEGKLSVNADSTGSKLFVLENELIENLPDAPLEIGWLNNGGFSFKNISAKLITSFNLGCVNKKENTVQILTKMSEKKFDLKPNMDLLTPRGSTGTTDNMYDLFICYENKGKLAVVEATYSDGSVWKAN